MQRRVIIPVILMIALCLPQVTDGAERTRGVGLHLGLNLGYVDYEEPMDTWDPGWDMGFAGGVFLEIPITQYLTLVPEMRFMRIQNQVEISPSFAEGHFNIRHDYISLPLILRVSILKNILFIDCGPAFSVLVSAKSLVDYTDPIGGPVDKTDDIKDIMENFNLSAVLGIVFDASNWNVPVELNTRYNHGFTEVAEEDLWLSDWKTREISVSLAYVFRF